jgi:ketosteroid isomerase-like protein
MTNLNDRVGGSLLAVVIVTLAGAGAVVAENGAAGGSLAAEVEATERAFAQTMAERDFEAFKSFLSEEAVFFSEPEPLRGKEAVAARWRGFFEGPEPPFSWEPSAVEVLPSGTLALSTGPVRDGEGRLIATFTSIWRRDESGGWSIVFDRGCDVCAEP